MGAKKITNYVFCHKQFILSESKILTTILPLDPYCLMKIINKLLQSTTNYTMILGILDYRLSIEINILGEIISSSGVTL